MYIKKIFNMLIPTTLSIIFGNDVIYEASKECELFEDKCLDDIYEEFKDKDKKSLKISKIRCFNKGKFLIKIKQYKYEFKFGFSFNKSDVVLPKGLTHLTLGSYFNRKINLPKSLTRVLEIRIEYKWFLK